MFKATLAEKRGEEWRPVTKKLREAVTEAIDTIIAIMKDPRAKDRLNAAKSVVEYARQFADDTEIRPAIAALQMAESLAAEDVGNGSEPSNDQTDVE